MNILYSNKQELKVVEKGSYKGINFEIVSYGSHPCCYIELPKYCKYVHSHYDDIPLSVHGGLTYKETEKDGSVWIGWDYAHCDDKRYYPKYDSFSNNGREWTVKELKKHIFDAITELIKLLEAQQ